MTFLTPVKQATYAPSLIIVVERPPLRRNDVVIEHLPSGMLRKARVLTCFWDDSMGVHGDWNVYLSFYPLVQDENGEWVQDMQDVQYTWTNPKVCKKVKE